MKTQLRKIALLSSPILAICGMMPIFIFVDLDLNQMLTALIGLTITLFIFWVINIFLLGFELSTFRRYVFSYSATLFLFIITHFFIPLAPPIENAVRFLLYPMIFILAINTIILMIIHSNLLQEEREEAELEVKDLKLSNLEAQKQVLIQQLQPHFLFNALSTLKSLIKENQQGAGEYVFKLSEFLRYSVQAYTNELIMLKEELKFTQDFIDLQKARFVNAFSCKIDIPNSILNKKLPVFALQTVVENAFKHNAFSEKKPLLLTINLEGNRLRVANNRQRKRLNRSPGTGLKNLKKRYLLVSKKYIEILDKEDTFIVYLDLLD